MRIALVVAVADNGVIGRDGALPWRIADDMKWFRRVTMGKPVVMGRKTFDSIGRALPGRANIVVTRDPSWRAEGVEAATSLEAALALALAAAARAGVDEICVIGGGDLYRQTIDRADRIYLTRVHARPAGDALFPELDLEGWTQKAEGAAAAGERNAHSCTFVILERRPGGAPALRNADNTP